MYCADGWIQASNATSDYFNTCGYTSIFSPPQFPLPGGGAGYAGFYSFPGWEENIGSCLTGPMIAGTQYTLNLNTAWSNGSTTLDLSIYGTPNCSDLPWNTSDCAVGSGAWILLGSVTVNYNTNGAWENVDITFVPPVNINAISIGGPCGGQTSGTNYYFVDELTLATTASFQSGSITESGNWCNGDLLLTGSTDTSGGVWQWYQDGIALIGEVNQTLDMMSYGPGNYSLLYTVGLECERSDYTLTIPDAPMANFIATNQCDGTAINFLDGSTIPTGTITNWDWDFGDGNTSTAQNPSYTYGTDGTYNVSLTVTSDQGCTNTFNQNVTVFPNPASDFEFIIGGISSNSGLLGGCLNDPISFNDNSTVPAPDNITGWAWDFGDGNTSTAQNPTYQYMTDGTYNVQLTVTTNNGCTNPYILPIDIYPIPTSNFTVPPVCGYDPSIFTDASNISSGSITNWQWDFGDGNTSTAQNPTNQYASDGTYNVELIVISNQGCSDTLNQNALVNPVPTADFTPTGACDYLPANFTDNTVISSGTVTWDWDFGDGNTSTVQNPSHQYVGAGTYNVELVVTSDQGCLDSITYPVNIIAQPLANFNFTDDCYYNLSNFTDASSAGVTNWAWDFGDGSPVDNNQNPSHQYMADGPYNVQLIVTAGSGCADTVTQSITMFPKPNASFAVTDECLYDPLNFVDGSTINAPDNITNWDWDFGDASTSTTQSPSHLYAVDGAYNVTLTTTSNNGCVDDTVITVNAFAIPAPDFTSTVECVGTAPTAFTDQSAINSGNITGWQWDFGDGNTSTNQNPNNQYALDGNYNVQLITTSDMGCIDSITLPAFVSATPTANFSFTNDCYYNPASFTDLSFASSGSITSWEWDFGDGSPVDNSQNPTHQYMADGNYIVELIVSAGVGCSDTIPMTISRFPKPNASFIVNDECLYDPAQFNDLTTINPPDNITSWNWDFGDGNTDVTASPSHQYNAEGTYSVTLTTISNNNCVDDTTLTFTIHPVPVADFSVLDVCVNTPPSIFNDNSSISSGNIVNWDWDFGDGTTTSGQNQNHSYASEGNYNIQLTVTSDFGCIHSTTLPTTVFEKPSANFTSASTIECNPACIQFTDLSTTATGTITNWSWDFDNGQIANDQHPMPCYQNPSDMVSYFDVGLIATNNYGCSDTANTPDYITIVPMPEAYFTYNPDVTNVWDPYFEFTNESIKADAYDWNFGDGTPNSSVEDPSHFYPEVANEYEVTLIASNYGMCFDTTTAILTVDEVIIFYVPNVFTPDGDEYNETWQPVFYSGYDPYDFHLLLFNRWGEVVFESYDASKGWNGTYSNQGLVEDGVYIWQIEFKEPMSDKRHKHRGHVTVLK